MTIESAGEATIPFHTRRREPRQQAGYAFCVAIKDGKSGAEKLFFAVDGRGVNDEEEQCQEERYPKAPRGGGKAEGHHHGAKVQGIARVGIWPGHGELSIFLHVARSIGAKQEPGGYQKETPGQRSIGWAGLPEVEGGKEKAARDSDAPRDSAPVIQHGSNSLAAATTCCGVMVNKPASGSACRVWSRLLSRWRSTLKGTPKGPLRPGSVGP